MTDRTSVCAEIQYETEGGSVHSDICPPDHAATFTAEYRAFLHANLDEWLDRSNGTGSFHIGEVSTDPQKARGEAEVERLRARARRDRAGYELELARAEAAEAEVERLSATIARVAGLHEKRTWVTSVSPDLPAVPLSRTQCSCGARPCPTLAVLADENGDADG